MGKNGAYRLLVVESFELESTSGHRESVQIRPLAGQPYSPSMLLECSRRMVDTSVYPLGTKFKVSVCLKQKLDCRPHLYCYHGDEIVPVSDAEAKRLVAGMKRGHV